MIAQGFLHAGHGLAAEEVFQYVSTPYTPFLTDTFAFDREFVKRAMATIIDVKGPHAHVIERLNMPASFVILDRVVWGVSALLGRLEARNRWRGILDEYRHGGAPATELGELELAWKRDRGFR